MRFQDPASTTPREPTLAEQRARQKAEQEERERRHAERAAFEEELRQREKRRKLLIGGGVGLGLVGLVAGYYLLATPDEVTAYCVNEEGVVVDDDYCGDDYHGGGVFFVGGMQYRHYYGDPGSRLGTRVSGGSYTKPANAHISTRSGSTIQRGGFGISGRSGSSGS